MLHRTSSLPKRRVASATVDSTASGPETSQITLWTSAPCSRASFAVSSSSWACTSASNRRAPSSARRSALALPMPVAAPVISTTLSSNRRMSFSSSPVEKADYTGPPDLRWKAGDS